MVFLGGQFKSATHGQFKSAQGGQFDRILHLTTMLNDSKPAFSTRSYHAASFEKATPLSFTWW